jgi:glycosyltransferase involved in cell wall biosynthesis
LSNQQPLVTAYIPTRNRAESVKKAVGSVLEQTWENIEIIVVDDASDDETPHVLEDLARSHNITVIRNEIPKGAAASRNIAIEQANGEFVAGLDDDDIWRPKRVELLLNEFSDGISAVCSNDRMVFGEKEIVWKKKAVITLQDLLFYNQAGNQVLTKKEYILEVGGYDETLPSAQDYDLWIRLAHDFGPIKCAPHTLQVVNMSDDRESITTSGNQIEGYRACFEKHRHKMNKEQETYQLYRIKMAAGEKISWLEMFRSVPSQLLVKEITRKLFL